MSAFFTAITTSEGLVHVVTKSRWLGVLSMPHTSVVPQAPADLKRLGSFIKWSTTDASVLGMLHDAIAALVKKTGASGLVEIGKGASVHGWCPPSDPRQSPHACKELHVICRKSERPSEFSHFKR